MLILIIKLIPHIELKSYIFKSILAIDKTKSQNKYQNISGETYVRLRLYSNITSEIIIIISRKVKTYNVLGIKYEMQNNNK